MKLIEHLTVPLERNPWSCIYRGAIGFALPPVFRALSGGRDSVWIVAALFLGVLLALRIVPAMLRKIFPFSAEAKAEWEARRHLSKQYDSYAWQKLFWIGLGLLLYAAIGGGLNRGEFVVMLLCLIGGGAAFLTWLATHSRTE